MTLSTIKHDQLSEFEYSHSLEWLETNGLGGWASSTVSGAHSRRYHGLLVAALHPPVGRTVLVSKLDGAILVAGERFELSCNQYPGALHPKGYQHLVGFERDIFPAFHYEAGAIKMKKTIAALQGENTTLILYEVIEAPQEFAFELLPLYAARDFHSLSRQNGSINGQFVFHDGILRVKNYEDTPEVFISVPGSVFREDQHWYYNFEYAKEQYRGLDFKEDLYSHGIFSVSMKSGGKLGIIISTEEPAGRNAFRLYSKEEKRRAGLIRNISHKQLKRLFLAADQFIVNRGDGLKTVIAGYHWFSDWGRDTMISLSGLCLSTGRVEDAKRILKTFSENISQGMLPNRFPDKGEIPEYNTIDATLWFFVAIYHYYTVTRDVRFIKSLLPVLTDIIEWHYKGTRYGIHVESDELLYGGQAGVQLTWMDAKVGDWVVTPRRGKAVEINALWYNALCIMGFLCLEMGKEKEAAPYQMKAGKVAENFTAVFWNEKGGYLFDYVDGAYKNEDIRPNQIYSISLPFPLLPKGKAEQVLMTVEKHLLTPRGLRSLNRSHESYKPVYGGDGWARDGAYHQGTVWSFLLGAYIDALIHLRGVRGKREARELLNTFLSHLDEGCVGSVSEIFDADPPHNPRGCVAQAWGVAEILRVSVDHRLMRDKIEKEDRAAVLHKPTRQETR
jgi:predicted glycogen debranching enzyme